MAWHGMTCHHQRLVPIGSPRCCFSCTALSLGIRISEHAALSWRIAPRDHATVLYPAMRLKSRLRYTECSMGSRYIYVDGKGWDLA